MVLGSEIRMVIVTAIGVLMGRTTISGEWCSVTTQMRDDILLSTEDINSFTRHLYVESIHKSNPFRPS